MEYKYPNTVKLQAVYKLAYKDEFLSINNLKVGDEIVWSFPYEKVVTAYGRKGQERYTYKKLCKGILKEDENGFLYAESIETMPFYFWERIGRKEGYVQRNKTSIIKFGIGFIN